MLRLILAGLLFGLFSTQTQAATYRYSFDVVQSDISFIDLLKYETTFVPGGGDAPFYRREQVVWNPGEREYYLRKLHPLGEIYEMAGPVVLDIDIPGLPTGDPSAAAQSSAISCVSGFLCLLKPFSSSFGTPFSEFWSLGNSKFPLSVFHRVSDTEVKMYGHNFSSGTTSCHFEPDCLVETWSPYANLDLANLTITEIAPVPLPATAWLLGLGILALGVRGRLRIRSVRS